MSIDNASLEDRLAKLEDARMWSPRVISRLETFIRSADDDDLFRINAIRFAAEKRIAADEAVDLFLFAAKFGIFEMDWHLVCPFCAHVVESFSQLGSLHSHFTCSLCSGDMDANLDDYIQVAFSLSPAVGDIIYHHPAALPERMPIEDYYFRYHVSKEVLALPDGRTYRDYILNMTKEQRYIWPQASVLMQVDTVHGMLHLSDVLNNARVTFMIEQLGSGDSQNVPIKLVDGKFDTPGRALGSMKLTVGVREFKYDQFGTLGNGPVVIELENKSNRVCPLWMVNFPMSSAGPVLLKFAPFLSGKRLLSTQTFLDLFRATTMPVTEGIGVKDLTYLFTDLKGSTALYDAIGDTNAFYLVRQHFETLGHAVARNHGAVVKTVGDAIMASYLAPSDAVRSAIDMLRDLETFNRSISERLMLKIGIHRGHSIAVTLNDRLDYFGQSVNIASRVQGMAGANEIFISEDVYTSPGVQEALRDCIVTCQQVLMKGVSGSVKVNKVEMKL